MLKYHIQTIELSSNAAVLDFDAIPQDYDDLELLISIRLTVNDANFRIRFNRNSSGVYNERILYGNGSSASSFSRSNADAYNYVYSVKSTETANTFSSHKLLVSNYTSSTAAKSTSIDGVTENNATAAVQYLHAGLFNSTAPVTSLQVFYNLGAGEVAQYSSASLYGIKRGSDGVTGVIPAAEGGTVTASGGYTIHTFQSSGTFTANMALDVEYLVIAGGGGGGVNAGSGGGAGGYRSSVAGQLSGGGASAEPALSLLAGNSYLVSVGAGGAAGTGSDGFTIQPGSNGSESIFASITSVGGGGGAAGGNIIVSNVLARHTGKNGGSGGGSSAYAVDGTAGPVAGGTGTTGQGFNGGTATSSGNGIASAGGGGAGGAGANATASSGQSISGSGGAGLSSPITGTSVTRASGGSAWQAAAVAGGGGGSGATNGAANTGGGGGDSGAGGSGVVIIRYLTPA